MIINFFRCIERRSWIDVPSSIFIPTDIRDCGLLRWHVHACCLQLEGARLFLWFVAKNNVNYIMYLGWLSIEWVGAEPQ